VGGTSVERTGHFVLEVRLDERLVQRTVLSNGATQLNLTLPDGRYRLKLRFVDSTSTRDLLPAYEAQLVVVGQERL
jgi:hypothetical protein